MPLTIVVHAGERTPSLTFDVGRVVIGRGSGCDVRLPDPSVSHRHLTVRMEGGEPRLVDEGSRNGTFVGGVRLEPQAPRVLRSGELVRVGRVWLEMRIDQRPATRDLAAATRDLALALVADAMRALGDDVTARAVVIEGPDAGAVLPLSEEGRTYVLGRGESCDLPLADKDASREHVQLVRRGSVVLIRDLGSKNGVYLGDVLVEPQRDIAWKPALMARIGHTVMALEEPVSSALAELERAPDEPMVTADIPPPPPPASAAKTSAPPSAPPPAPLPVPAAVAPLAGIDPGKTAPSTRRRASRWSSTDVAVMLTAVLVLLLSGAGLVWLLRG